MVLAKSLAQSGFSVSFSAIALGLVVGSSNVGSNASNLCLAKSLDHPLSIVSLKPRHLNRMVRIEALVVPAALL